MVNSTTASRIKIIHHRGWSTHAATDRYRKAKPNQKVSGFCVTSGDLGTYAMHPRRKRNTRLIRHLQNHQPSTINHQPATNRYARADTAVRPYAEVLFIHCASARTTFVQPLHGICFIHRRSASAFTLTRQKKEKPSPQHYATGRAFQLKRNPLAKLKADHIP